MATTAPYAQRATRFCLMVGDDHTEAFEKLPDAVEAIGRVAPRTRARIATLEEFVAALPAPRGVMCGELVSGKYRPILRGVNSTRGSNRRTPPASGFSSSAASRSTRSAAAVPAMRSLWRTLLENHPHDSICGCSIDAVHDLDMQARFSRVRHPRASAW